MINLKKAKTIVKAFSEDLPVEEEWYRKRLTDCDTCEWNSKNKEVNTLLTKTKESTICKGTSVCTACGCCIAQKASVKSEVCGMKEKGLVPKWGAIEIEGKVDSRITVENKTEGYDRFFVDGTGAFVLEISSKEVSVPFKFRVDGGEMFNIRTLTNTCSCTSSGVNEIAQGNYDVYMTVSTNSLQVGVPSTKIVKAKYTIGREKEKDLLFKLEITKK
jgi:hypothetical protein